MREQLWHYHGQLETLIFSQYDQIGRRERTHVVARSRLSLA
jgi:hypothetical protein